MTVLGSCLLLLVPSKSFSSEARKLLRVQLDDQLLLDRGVDDLAGRQCVDQDAHPVGDDLDPGRHRSAAGFGAGDDERRHLEALRPHLDDVVLGDEERRDVDLLAVDEEVPVLDQLAGHVAAVREPGPVDDVVETPLQDLQQVLTGLAGTPVGLLVVTAELLLEHAVDAGALLLLPLLQQVLAVLGAAAAVLTRRVRADLDRALRGLALAALEEQLHLLAAAATAVRACVPSHVSNSPPLGRAATVVRNWGDVGDRADLQADRLQRPDGGLAAGAGTLHEHVDLAHAVLLRAAGSGLGCHLRGERCRLARALEAHLAGARPGDHVAQRVGDRDDRVVERALDVGVPVSDVLLLLAAYLLRGRALLCGRHYFFPTFFLPATVLRGPLRVRALVWGRGPGTARPRRSRTPA